MRHVMCFLNLEENEQSLVWFVFVVLVVGWPTKEAEVIMYLIVGSGGVLQKTNRKWMESGLVWIKYPDVIETRRAFLTEYLSL